MKAAFLEIDGFEIRQLDMPQVGDDEVVIETIACGICSGDVFVYKNREELATTYSRLGHEGSGTIVEVGRNVTGLRLGDVVTSFGIPAYADYFVTTPEELVMLAPEIDPVNALGEPIACCVHASNRFGIRPGDRVALVGCGFMGLICLQLARVQGAGFVCAIDLVDYRLAMSRWLGADATINLSESNRESMLQQIGEFDLVIEAAGTQSAVDRCTDLVAQHGRIILVGYHQSNDGVRSVNMKQWNYKAIDVVNGHVRRQDEKRDAMRQGMELMKQRHLITAPLITTYELPLIDQAFQDLINGKEGLFKAVVLMDRQ